MHFRKVPEEAPPPLILVIGIACIISKVVCVQRCSRSHHNIETLYGNLWGDGTIEHISTLLEHVACAVNVDSLIRFATPRSVVDLYFRWSVSTLGFITTRAWF